MFHSHEPLFHSSHIEGDASSASLGHPQEGQQQPLAQHSHGDGDISQQHHMQVDNGNGNDGMFDSESTLHSQPSIQEVNAREGMHTSDHSASSSYSSAPVYVIK